jgi:lysophospholipase L1-like esterase
METRRWMMRRIATLLLIGLLVGLMGAPAAAGQSVLPATMPSWYLALGDSLAVGVQPLPAQSQEPAGETNRGYVDQLYAQLRAEDPTLRLKKLGCAGESTTSMRFGGFIQEVRPPALRCAYPHGSQLAEAVAFLQKYQVALVTINIGANDFAPDFGGGVETIAANLPVILAELRAAAGPDVPIVGMNYYQAGLVTWFEDPDSLQGLVAQTVALNDFLEGFYADAGSPVADVEAAFSTTDFTFVTGIPLNVLRICQWTWMCAPPPRGPDPHPNDDGYAVIAEAFWDVLPL